MVELKFSLHGNSEIPAQHSNHLLEQILTIDRMYQQVSYLQQVTVHMSNSVHYHIDFLSKEQKCQ